MLQFVDVGLFESPFDSLFLFFHLCLSVHLSVTPLFSFSSVSPLTLSLAVLVLGQLPTNCETNNTICVFFSFKIDHKSHNFCGSKKSHLSSSLFSLSHAYTSLWTGHNLSLTDCGLGQAGLSLQWFKVHCWVCISLSHFFTIL